jgi:hypothetical protein
MTPSTSKQSIIKVSHGSSFYQIFNGAKSDKFSNSMTTTNSLFNPTTKKRELIILIDSGSTHNFVDQKLAQALHLAVMPIEEFVVNVSIKNTRFQFLYHIIFLTITWTRCGIRHAMA